MRISWLVALRSSQFPRFSNTRAQMVGRVLIPHTSARIVAINIQPWRAHSDKAHLSWTLVVVCTRRGYAWPHLIFRCVMNKQGMNHLFYLYTWCGKIRYSFSYNGANGEHCAACNSVGTYTAPQHRLWLCLFFCLFLSVMQKYHVTSWGYHPLHTLGYWKPWAL